jgi:hypothetical protein
MPSDDLAGKYEGDNEEAAFVVFEEGAIDARRCPRCLSDILYIPNSIFNCAFGPSQLESTGGGYGFV